MQNDLPVNTFGQSMSALSAMQDEQAELGSGASPDRASRQRALPPLPPLNTARQQSPPATPSSRMAPGAPCPVLDLGLGPPIAWATGEDDNANHSTHGAAHRAAHHSGNSGDNSNSAAGAAAGDRVWRSGSVAESEEQGQDMIEEQLHQPDQSTRNAASAAGASRLPDSSAAPDNPDNPDPGQSMLDQARVLAAAPATSAVGPESVQSADPEDAHMAEEEAEPGHARQQNEASTSAPEAASGAAEAAADTMRPGAAVQWGPSDPFGLRSNAAPGSSGGEPDSPGGEPDLPEEGWMWY